MLGVMSARAGVRRLAEVVERHRRRTVEGCEGAKVVSRRVSIVGKMFDDGRAQWRDKGAKAMLDAFFELVQLEVQSLVGQCYYGQ